MTPFPHTTVNVLQKKPSRLIGTMPVRQIELFCDSVMPADIDNMVMCDYCTRWFHLKCIGLHSPPVTEEWLCDSCTLK